MGLVVSPEKFYESLSAEEKEALTSVIIDNLSQGDRCELFGLLVDVVEDWLEEKGITKEMIPNDEREDDDEYAAIIYGSDYDDLADRFSSVLGISRYEDDREVER